MEFRGILSTPIFIGLKTVQTEFRDLKPGEMTWVCSKLHGKVGLWLYDDANTLWASIIFISKDIIWKTLAVEEILL